MSPPSPPAVVWKLKGSGNCVVNKKRCFAVNSLFHYLHCFWLKSLRKCRAAVILPCIKFSIAVLPNCSHGSIQSYNENSNMQVYFISLVLWSYQCSAMELSAQCRGAISVMQWSYQCSAVELSVLCSGTISAVQWSYQCSAVDLSVQWTYQCSWAINAVQWGSH